MRIVCAGHVNWDVTLRVDRLPVPDGEAVVQSRREGGGGSAANTACGLAALDCEATLVGSVGNDELGERVQASLRAAGVTTAVRVVDDAETTTKYVLVDDDGEVALLGTDGANEALEPTDVDASLLDGADGLHLTGQRPDTATRLAALAADRDITVSFDPGRRLADRDYGAVLERTDLLFVTDREAAAIDVAADVPARVTKHGNDGATLECPTGRFTHGGYALSGVDSTGAGDAFAAGFLAVWLGDGDPERALSVGNACGALAASIPGSSAPLSWDAIDEVVS